MNVEVDTSSERKAWWSAQRRRYNIGLIVAAPISAALVVTVWAVFEERLPCLEVTGFSLVVGLILFALGLGAANIFYFLGPLSERVIRPRHVTVFRRSIYLIGFAFSLLLVFSPPILNLVAAISNSPCTDRFGRRHALSSGSISVYSFVPRTAIFHHL
jgi:hypothetical protein